MMIKNNALKAAENNNFIVFAGTNDDGLKPTLIALREKYVEKAFDDFDYVEMYGDELDIEHFAQNILATPMMSEKKVIIIRNGNQLSPSQCREINALMDNAAERILAVIIYTDSSKYHYNVVKKAKEYFTNAYIVELRKRRELNTNDIVQRAAQAQIKISEKTARKMEFVSDGNPDIINNLISTAWMIGEEQSLDDILSDKSGFDIAPVMHNEFILHFSMCNAKKCFDVYRQLIKWHVLSPDGLIIILMNHLQNMKRPPRNRSEKRMNPEKWTNAEIDKAYFLFYNVLRNFRTLRREYAVLVFEQVLVNVLNA